MEWDIIYGTEVLTPKKRGFCTVSDDGNERKVVGILQQTVYGTIKRYKEKIVIVTSKICKALDIIS